MQIIRFENGSELEQGTVEACLKRWQVPILRTGIILVDLLKEDRGFNTEVLIQIPDVSLDSNANMVSRTKLFDTVNRNPGHYAILEKAAGDRLVEKIQGMLAEWEKQGKKCALLTPHLFHSPAVNKLATFGIRFTDRGMGARIRGSTCVISTAGGNASISKGAQFLLDFINQGENGQGKSHPTGNILQFRPRNGGNDSR